MYLMQNYFDRRITDLSQASDEDKSLLGNSYHGLGVVVMQMTDYDQVLILSRLSYTNLQGTFMKRSHMTWGLLIHSLYNDREVKKVCDFSTFSKWNEITTWGC